MCIVAAKLLWHLLNMTVVGEQSFDGISKQNTRENFFEWTEDIGLITTNAVWYWSMKFNLSTTAAAIFRLSGNDAVTGLILGLHPANESVRYFVATYLIGWSQAKNQPWVTSDTWEKRRN